MDTFLYRRYHDAGGRSDFLAWESSEGVESWDNAPAPALVAKRLIEGVTKRVLPPRYARILNNATHWGFGLALVVRGAVPASGGSVSSFPFQSVRAVFPHTAYR